MMSLQAIQYIFLLQVTAITLVFGYEMRDSVGVMYYEDEGLGYLDYLTSETLPKLGDPDMNK